MPASRRRTRIEIGHQAEHHGQRGKQQGHQQALLLQPLAEFHGKKVEDAIVQLVGLGHLRADALVELFPGTIQRIGHDHLVLQDVAAHLQRLAAGARQRIQTPPRIAGRQRVLQLRGVLHLQLLQLQHEVVQRVAGIGVQVTLAKGVGAYRASLAERGADGRRDGRQQFGQQPNLALEVLAEPGLPGHEFDHHLRLTQQRLGHRRLGLQRLLGLSRPQAGHQLVAPGIEFRHLLGRIADRGEGLQLRRQLGLDTAQAGAQSLDVAGLADDRLDAHQVLPVLHAAPYLQGRTEQFQTLQLRSRADEGPVRLAHQVVIAQQHGNEEQDADQTELHAEAQAVHERDRGIQQAIHTTSPKSYWYGLARNCSAQQGSSESGICPGYTGYR